MILRRSLKDKAIITRDAMDSPPLQVLTLELIQINLLRDVQQAVLFGGEIILLA